MIKTVTIEIDTDKCKGCGSCVDTCHRRVLEIQGGVCVPIRPENCRFCMLCVSACKVKALRVIV